MGGDRAGQLALAVLEEPASASLAVTQSLERIVRGEEPIHVVEERGRLHQGAIDGDAARCHAGGEEGGHFGHTGDMAYVPLGRVEAGEEFGGGAPIGDGHGLILGAPQRKSASAASVTLVALGRVGVARPPEAWTRRSWPSVSTVTLPSRSVRYVFAPTLRRRSRVCRVGWP